MILCFSCCAAFNKHSTSFRLSPVGFVSSHRPILFVCSPRSNRSVRCAQVRFQRLPSWCVALVAVWHLLSTVLRNTSYRWSVPTPVWFCLLHLAPVPVSLLLSPLLALLYLRHVCGCALLRSLVFTSLLLLSIFLISAHCPSCGWFFGVWDWLSLVLLFPDPGFLP